MDISKMILSHNKTQHKTKQQQKTNVGNVRKHDRDYFYAYSNATAAILGRKQQNVTTRSEATWDKGLIAASV